jgi:hypothetical protein
MLRILIHFSLPLWINLLVLYTTNFWGFDGVKPFVAIGNAFTLLAIGIIWLYNLKIKSNIHLDNSGLFAKIFPYLFAGQFLLFILYPFQNLNYGDGIILLENVFLEGSLFGYQISLDEIWEAFLHSYVFSLFPHDPRLIYRVFSTIAGFLFLAMSIHIYQKERLDKSIYSLLLFLSPGGLLLFYGYSENYTLITMYLFFMLYLGRQWILENKDETSIFYMAILGAIGASFHLVFGYMIISLVYYTWYISKKKNFIRNSIIASCIGVGWIGGLFAYFLFFSDPTTNPSQTHVLTPPLYPWKRLISMNHLKEILSVTWFTTAFPITIISLSFLFKKKESIEILKKPENKYILFAALGFYIHSFVHNPSLGFPADWDLFSFYFIPLTYLAFILFPVLNNYIIYTIPLAIYFIGFQISLATHLTDNPPENEVEYHRTIEIAKDYIAKNRRSIQEVDPAKKKLYLKLDHFLYKAEIILNKMSDNPGNQNKSELLTDIQKYKDELKRETTGKEGKYSKQWLKNYLEKLTEFHHQFILIRQEDKKYHLEMENSL